MMAPVRWGDLYVQAGAADPPRAVLLQVNPLAISAEIRAEIVHVDQRGGTRGVEVDLAEVSNAGIAGPLGLQLRTGIDAPEGFSELRDIIRRQQRIRAVDR